MPIRPISPEAQARSDIGLLALGFTNQTAYSTMSGRFNTVQDNRGNTLGWPYAGYSQRQLYFTERPELPVVIQVEDFKIKHGMSGGAVVDQYENLEGLNVWVREQGISQSFFIPIQSVAQFLKQKHPQTLPSDEPSALQQKLNPTGGNGHSEGGGNGHTEGEGPPLSKATRIDRWRGAPRDRIEQLSDLFFPAEGVVNPANPQEIILGMNQQSVDGQDDLARIKNQQNPPPDIVSKANSPQSFPPIEIRTHILSRFAGQYVSILQQADGLPETAGRSSYYIKEQGSSFYEKNNDLTGAPTLALDINSTENKIRLKIAAHFLLDKFQPHPLLPVTALDDTFQVEFDEKAQKIYLQPVSNPGGKIRLSCKNDQYLKLNCANDQMSLSLHMVRPGEIEMVMAIMATSKSFFLHIYSKLRLVSSPSSQ